MKDIVCYEKNSISRNMYAGQVQFWLKLSTVEHTCRPEQHRPRSSASAAIFQRMGNRAEVYIFELAANRHAAR